MPAMDQNPLAEVKRLEAAGQFDNPRYEELLIKHFYVIISSACLPTSGPIR